jgi:benzoate/toluate 1,2-dioxygenase reductase subunit
MGLITVPVRRVERATPRTRVLVLDLSNGTFPFLAGQAVNIGLHDSALRKPYSIASAPWEVRQTGVMEVLVQVEDSGGPDPHLELAEPGTLLDVDGPFGTFRLPADSSGLLFVAGGTGIAPLRSMMMERLARLAGERTDEPISVVYSARVPEEFAYRQELEARAAAGQLTLHLTVTRDERAPWPGRRGRIDRALIEQSLPSSSAHCFVCGPPNLVSDVTRQLRELGVAESLIQIEKY